MTKKPATQPQPPRETKISKVITLLKSAEGATLDQLMKATGWQAHTTRAALTGLKKKGHVIEREKHDDGSCYRIAAGA
jgi:hypothetical protein